MAIKRAQLRQLSSLERHQELYTKAHISLSLRNSMNEVKLKKRKLKKKVFIPKEEPDGMKQWQPTLTKPWQPSSMPTSPRVELNFEYDH